uniref:Uncharacterized protein n=1 Tax=Anguilla anguilla TaxID=7936 RepID=A0A0E9XM13_ANGAN
MCLFNHFNSKNKITSVYIEKLASGLSHSTCSNKMQFYVCCCLFIYEMT